MTEGTGIRSLNRAAVWYAVWIVLLVAIAAFKIRSFVTAQDPFFYIGLAKSLLRYSPGSELFWHAFFRVAPGYPLLLGVSLATLGDFGPYFVNPVFAVFFSWSLYVLLREGSGVAGPALIAALLSMLVIFFGYGLNIYFLLYPFRGIAAYALVFAGYALVEKAASASNPRSALLGAGALLVLAVAIRETMAICLLLAAGRWIFAGAPSRKQVGWFLLPVSLLIAAAAAVYLFTDQFLSHQARYVWSVLPNFSERFGSVSQYLRQLVELAGYVADSFTWPGIVLLMLGLFATRRLPTTWFYFVIPSACLLLFYAGIEPHRRYALSVIVFLSPLAGEGLVWVVKQAATRSKWTEHSIRKRHVAICVVLAAFMMLLAARLTPWGPSVTRGEVRRFQGALSEMISDRDVVYHEPISRYLGDALISYTNAETENSLFNLRRRISEEGRHFWYFRPANAEAIYTPITHRFPVSVESRLRELVDLVSYTGEEGLIPVVEIAGGRFEVYRIEPWSRREVSQSILAEAGESLTVWLDFQSADPGIGKSVRILESESGRAVHAAEIASGNGLTAHFVPADVITTSLLLLEVRSETELPGELIHDVVVGEAPASFPLTHGRVRSVYRWFRPPFESVRGEPKYLAVCKTGGRLCLPPIYGPAESIETLLVLDPVAGADREVALVYKFGEQTVGEYRSRFSEVPQWNSFRLPLALEGTESCVEIFPDPVGCHGGEARIRMARIWIR